MKPSMRMHAEACSVHAKINIIAFDCSRSPRYSAAFRNCVYSLTMSISWMGSGLLRYAYTTRPASARMQAFVCIVTKSIICRHEPIGCIYICYIYLLLMRTLHHQVIYDRGNNLYVLRMWHMLTAVISETYIFC